MPTEPPLPPLRAAGDGDRIAKLLARAGIASRREVERMIADGRVARDGVVIDTPATLLTSLHGITVDGQPVAAPAPARLFVYHKPVGLLVTERDPAGRPTIYDRLPADLPRVVPVGRLDLATEGLLLLTTDGGLKRQLELPATGVERTYRARAYGPVSQAQLEELIHGIEIEGMRYGPIDANLERRTGANGWIELTLTEGKNREVRRVLEHLGLEISRLIRTRYGPFVLADMAPGDVGEIRQHDLEVFRKALKSGGGKAAGGALQPVVAEPHAKHAPVTAPTAARVRPAARPVRREGNERPPRAAAPSRAAASTHRERPMAADRPRDERPRAFGDRTRSAVSAREARPAPGEREQPRRGAGHSEPGNDRPVRARSDNRTPDARDTRSDRPARADAATQRPASSRPVSSRPGGDRSPSSDRSRGPAGGRGKPQDPRRPKTPPRGKR